MASLIIKEAMRQFILLAVKGEGGLNFGSHCIKRSPNFGRYIVTF